MLLAGVLVTLFVAAVAGNEEHEIRDKAIAVMAKLGVTITQKENEMAQAKAKAMKQIYIIKKSAIEHHPVTPSVENQVPDNENQLISLIFAVNYGYINIDTIEHQIQQMGHLIKPRLHGVSGVGIKWSYTQVRGGIYILPDWMSKNYVHRFIIVFKYESAEKFETAIGIKVDGGCKMESSRTAISSEEGCSSDASLSSSAILLPISTVTANHGDSSIDTLSAAPPISSPTTESQVSEAVSPDNNPHSSAVGTPFRQTQSQISREEHEDDSLTTIVPAPADNNDLEADPLHSDDVTLSSSGTAKEIKVDVSDKMEEDTSAVLPPISPVPANHGGTFPTAPHSPSPPISSSTEVTPIPIAFTNTTPQVLQPQALIVPSVEPITQSHVSQAVTPDNNPQDQPVQAQTPNSPPAVETPLRQIQSQISNEGDDSLTKIVTEPAVNFGKTPQDDNDLEADPLHTGDETAETNSSSGTTVIGGAQPVHRKQSAEDPPPKSGNANRKPAPTGAIDVTGQFDFLNVRGGFPKEKIAMLLSKGTRYILHRCNKRNKRFRFALEGLIAVITVQLGAEVKLENKFRLVRLETNKMNVALDDIREELTFRDCKVFQNPDGVEKWSNKQPDIDEVEFMQAVKDGCEVFVHTLLTKEGTDKFSTERNKMLDRKRDIQFGATAQSFRKVGVNEDFVQLVIQLV